MSPGITTVLPTNVSIDGGQSRKPLAVSALLNEGESRSKAGGVCSAGFGLRGGHALDPLKEIVLSRASFGVIRLRCKLFLEARLQPERLHGNVCKRCKTDSGL